MYSTKCYAVVIITISAVIFQIDGFKMPNLEVECLGEKHDMSQYIKGFMGCAAEHMSKEDIAAFTNPSTTDEQRKVLGKKAHDNTCIRVCQWKKHINMLKEDGSLNEEEVSTSTDKMFPEAAREEMKTGTKKCHTDHSKTFDDKNNCEGYNPFRDCITEVFKKACKLEKLPFEDQLS